MAAPVAITDAEIRLVPVATRLPFEYGIVTLTRMPHCFVRLTLTIDGAKTTGIAAEHLPPKWFTKLPDQPIDEEIEIMIEVVERACTAATEATGETVFDCWEEIYQAQQQWGTDSPHPPLLWGFGVTFVERAMIDAFCRATDTSFADAVRDGSLGIEPGRIYPELEGTSPGDVLDEPLDQIRVRHTVGYNDPLDERPADAPEDGLPVTLEENIEQYGVDRFKLKIGGDVDRDVSRLRDVLSVAEQQLDDYAFTLDANEQYDSVSDLRNLLERLTADDAVDGFRERLLFVEQPFDRSIALTPTVGDQLADWEDAPPIVIDESDGELQSFGRALELGYAGTSYKSCKGVFKGIANACLAAERRAAGAECVISGEDLSTIGPVCLPQDLAAMATLGIEHVERNGHHYFRGLSMYDEDVQQTVLSAHPDLYRRHDDGFATLDVDEGVVPTMSVTKAPFGFGGELDLSAYATPETWNFDV